MRIGKQDSLLTSKSVCWASNACRSTIENMSLNQRRSNVLVPQKPKLCIEYRIKSLETALARPNLGSDRMAILSRDLADNEMMLEELMGQESVASRYRPSPRAARRTSRPVRRVSVGHTHNHNHGRYSSKTTDRTLAVREVLSPRTSDLRYRDGMGIEATEQANLYLSRMAGRDEDPSFGSMASEIAYFAVSRGVEAGSMLLASLVSVGVQHVFMPKNEVLMPTLPSNRDNYDPLERMQRRLK